MPGSHFRASDLTSVSLGDLFRTVIWGQAQFDVLPCPGYHRGILLRPQAPHGRDMDGPGAIEDLRGKHSDTLGRGQVDVMCPLPETRRAQCSAPGRVRGYCPWRAVRGQGQRFSLALSSPKDPISVSRGLTCQ